MAIQLRLTACNDIDLVAKILEIHEQGQRHVNQAKDSNHPSNQFTKTDNNSFKIWSHGKNDTSDGVHSMNNKPKKCKIGQWKHVTFSTELIHYILFVECWCLKIIRNALKIIIQLI